MPAACTHTRPYSKNHAMQNRRWHCRTWSHPRRTPAMDLRGGIRPVACNHEHIPYFSTWGTLP